MIGQCNIAAALPLGKEPWYPLDRRLGGPHNWYGDCGNGIKIPSLPL